MDQPKTICYRDLKNFHQKVLNLESKMAHCPNFFEKVLQIFQDTVQLFAPLKKNTVCYNNKTFMTKNLRKAIISYEINITKTGHQKIA